jgi:hypothetical protein
MLRKLFCLVIPVLLGSSIFLQAETAPIQLAEHHLLRKIIENQQNCVSAFEGDKIFIQPENIVPTKHGLFVNLNGSEFYPLPLIQFDQNGHFIEGYFTREIELAGSKVRRPSKGPCPACDVDTDSNGTKKTSVNLYSPGIR